MYCHYLHISIMILLQAKPIITSIYNLRLLTSQQKIIYIPINKNENHWLLVVILPNYQTVISTDSLSYNNENIVQFAMQFLRIYTTLHKIYLKAENWSFFQSSWYTNTGKYFRLPCSYTSKCLCHRKQLVCN